MANEETIDEGLTELTSDVLGPIADDPAESDTATVEQSADETQEQSQPTEQPVASAEAPTPQAPEPTIEIDGRQYTREQLAAALQTRQQFPHLQEKYTKLLEEHRARQAQSEQRSAQQPNARPDPKQVVAQIRASFDEAVKTSVSEGFIEEDFALLYPNLAASMVMNRDALTAVAGLVQKQAEKIATYERQIEANDTRSEIDNNMVALSSQHPAFAPLADPATRNQFFGYLVQLNPPVSALSNPDFMVSQWVAFKKNDYLGGIDAARKASAQQTAKRTVQRRQAQGDALPGSRPAAAPQGDATPLNEMVEDFFAYKA